jgi:shikimate kinase
MSLLFLVGFMGVGKTTIAKKLAKKLSYDWVDTDMLIAQNEGISVTEIFKLKGEEHFRKLEIEVLHSFHGKSKLIIATGGGMPCYNDLMDKMNAMGITIYLERSPKELFQRLKNATQNRPLLQQKNDDELLKYIEENLSTRVKTYQKARYTADRFNQTPEKIITIIQSLDS